MEEKRRKVAAKVISQERTDRGFRVVTEVANKRGRFTVTDTYEGTAEGVLVTSTLHRVSGGGIVPRSGKSFRVGEICSNRQALTCLRLRYITNAPPNARAMRSVVTGAGSG